MLRISPVNLQMSAGHKLNHLVQSLLLLSGMGLVLALLGWIIAGPDAVVWVMLGGALLFLLSPRISPRLVVKMFGGRRLAPGEAPALYGLIDELARRAGLDRSPAMYYVPSRVMNAFAVGGRSDAVLAVTDGLLHGLSSRELATVLAHEVSHIQANDTGVMGLADAFSRLTGMLSLLGQVLVLVNLPMVLFTDRGIPWVAVLVLLFAPTLSALMQLALSRRRELDADLGAARLTGDPIALVSALRKLERHQAGRWERIFLPGRRMPDLSLLHTHPGTEERVRRLLMLLDREPSVRSAWPSREQNLDSLLGSTAPVTREPRWHMNGLWY